MLRLGEGSYAIDSIPTKAHSFYFSKDAFNDMVRGSKYVANKEFLAIPGAVHTDLYDNLAVIPFDKMGTFFKKNLD